MCGRYTLKAELEAVAEEYGICDMPDLGPRYNIAPSQDVAVVRFDAASGVRKLDHLRWGLVPSWAKDPAIGNKMINARAETVAEKPAFRSAFKSRRCLVLADGFYEWMKAGTRKQPYHIKMTDDHPFGFAGLHERWGQGDAAIDSCTIITTSPNGLMEPIHDRMPVILRREDYGLWLDPAVKDVGLLNSMLVPYPAEEMEAFPVSTLVNSPAHDRPQCVAPVTP